MSEKELEPKQLRFVEEYIIDLNATQAAIRAGYSPKTANEQGARLLAKASIQEEIKKRQAKIAEKLEVTAERIIAEYAKLAFSNMQDFVNWTNGTISIRPASELTPEQTACVAEISESVTEKNSHTKIKLHDKKGALDSLARHLGMFADRIKLGGDENSPPVKTESTTTLSIDERIANLIESK